jgi:hypothetical protein
MSWAPYRTASSFGFFPRYPDIRIRNDDDRGLKVRATVDCIIHVAGDFENETRVGERFSHVLHVSRLVLDD